MVRECPGSWLTDLGLRAASLLACPHKAEAASVGSMPIPSWSALVVLFLNKPMV